MWRPYYKINDVNCAKCDISNLLYSNVQLKLTSISYHFLDLKKDKYPLALTKPDFDEKRINDEVKRLEAAARSIYIEEERTFDYSRL